MKYIIFQKYTSYGYVVVEANNKEEAMNHTHYAGDEIIISNGGFQNLEAHPVEWGTSVMKGDLSSYPEMGFQIVNQKRKKQFIKEWFDRFGWKPNLNLVRFYKIRKCNSK